MIGLLSRPIPFNGHASPFALVRPVVPDGAVDHTAVVPERNVIALPPEPDLEVDLLAVIEQQVEHRAALRLAQLVDPRGEGAVDEDRLPPGLWMRPDDGMVGVRIRPARVVHTAIRVAAAIN